MSRKYRVLLTGGGTGGHVYPCLSIFSYLKQHEMVADALYLGIRGRAEDQIVPPTGIKLHHITSAPIAGGSLMHTIRAIFLLIKGTVLALREIRTFKPDLVIATGGYVSAPVLFAAYLSQVFHRLKIVVEEQNLVPGLLNKVGSLLADVVLVNFKETIYFTWGKKAVYVGYPLREQYYAPRPERSEVRASLQLPQEKYIVLITGGSLGARSINRVVAETLPALAGLESLYIVHSIGLSDTDEYHAVADTSTVLRTTMAERFNPENLTALNNSGEVFYRAFPFIHRMFEYQLAADLIISRAGAGALAEIAAIGVASLIIPKRGLPGDHQELNAINMADRGCCSILFERKDRRSQIDTVPAQEFQAHISRMVNDPAKTREQAEQTKKLSAQNTDKTIVATIEKVMKNSPVDYIDEIIEPQFVKFQRQFDHLVAYLDNVRHNQDFDNPYLRFYSMKINDYLQSTDFLEVNKGIKLIGPLQRTDLYEYIRDNFKKFKGFLRRNCLISLQKAEHFHIAFRQIIDWSLHDSYYEVRREAMTLLRRFATDLATDEPFRSRIKKMLSDRSESFEVKVEIIKLAVLIFDEDT